MVHPLHRRNPRTVLIFFVAILAASGGLVFYLYSETQSQAQTILEQAQDILAKAQQIASLESTVAGQSATITEQREDIAGLESDVDSLSDEVAELSSELGVTRKSLEELRPVIRDYYAVGVRGDGTGVVINLQVKVVKGTGAISASINKVELLSGVQDSIRTSADVASDYSGVPINDKDITVSFVHGGNDIVTLDGGSAGGAITVTMIGALTDRIPKTTVLMTGTIAPNGGIGLVGSTLEKARAARDEGASTFLVPVGTSGFTLPGIELVPVSTIDEVVQRVLS